MQMLSPIGPCVACSADKADWVASHAAEGTCLSHRPAHHEHVLTPIWLCRFETDGHRFGVEKDARWGKKLCDASIRTDRVSLDVILRRHRAQPLPRRERQPQHPAATAVEQSRRAATTSLLQRGGAKR